jgi:hypothetical protein
VKNVKCKELKLGNMSIDGTVGKGSDVLQKKDILAQFIPRNIFGQFVEMICQIGKVRFKITGIRF